MEHGKGLKPLARLGVAHIDLCDCGMVYLGVGPVTVKLSREAFDQLVQGVRVAERALNEPQALSAAPLPASNIVRFAPRPISP